MTGRTVYVGNLPVDAGESNLHQLFARVGRVAKVTLVRDRATGRMRGFGFVEMGSDAEAQRAIRELNTYEFGGRDLTVNQATPSADAGPMRRRRSVPRP